MLPDALEWFRERPLASAILVSLAIHATALTLFPQLRPLKNDQPPLLQVEILNPPREERAAAELPKAAAPQPEVKRLPVPAPERPRQKVPKVVPELSVRQQAPTAVAPASSQPEVLTAAPEAPSQFSVPVAPASSSAPVRETEVAPPDPDLLAGYGRALSDAIGRYQRYPRVAQMRGWQGTATVALKFGSGHKLLSTTLQKSSGHEILDDQAVEMVKDAQPLPKPPESLRNRDFTVLVPIAFRLKE
jgi:protein TonB